MRLVILKALLRRAFSEGNRRLVRIFLRSLIDGRAPEVRAIGIIIDDMRAKAARINEQMAKIKYFNVVTQKSPSLEPLRAYLRERQAITDFILKSYGKNIIDEAQNLITLSGQIDEKLSRLDGLGGVNIGRRREDLFRRIGLKNLEKSFLYGSPTQRGDQLILAELKKNSKIFDSKGKMILPVRSKNPITGELDYYGKTRAWSPEHYSEMVSLSTIHEMDTVGNIENARAMQTRLLKWSTTGKSKAQYIEEHDPRCAAVDNEYCTYVNGGIALGGRKIPHIKDLLPGPFNIPHPYCRHTLKPVPESLLEAA